LFVYQGNVYSFSRVPPGGLAATLTPSLRRAVATSTIGILVVACQLWRERERSIFSAIVRTYGHAGLQLYFLAVAVSACAWWNGPWFTWRVADLTVAYVHSTILLQAMLVAALAIPLPITVIVLQQGVLFMRERYEHYRAQR
jgi:hypothetical protein